MVVTVKEIAALVGGKVEGDEMQEIRGANKIEISESGDLTFLGNMKYETYLYDSGASAVLVQEDFEPSQPVSMTLIRVQDVYASLAILLDKFNTSRQVFNGISEHAVVDPSAIIGENVSIGPFAYVGPNAIVASNVRVSAHVYIGGDCRIGDNTILESGVRILENCIVGNDCIIQSNTVVGSDGFGYRPDDEGRYHKVPQTGNVVLEDQVELGANCTIDRATMGSTIIRKGCKLDNLIQVAHNVEIGENTVIAAQTGIAGSTKIEEGCTIGGQVGIVGHLKIAKGTMIQAQSGVQAPTKEGAKLYGYPAMDYYGYLKAYAVFKKLPQMVKDISDINKRLKTLE